MHPVLWTEGLFLRPQQFQQQDRHQAWQREQRVRAISPWCWGWRQLVVDSAALRFGRVALAQAQGILPDGLAFDLAAGDLAPAALEIPEDARDALVVLALPLARQGLPDSDAETRASGDGTAAAPSDPTRPQPRWRTLERPLADAHAATPREALVQVGRPNLRLMLARDVGDGEVTLGVCRVRQRHPDAQLSLDPAYLPPLLDALAHPRLAGHLREVQGLVHQRARTLAERLVGPNPATAADAADLWMLATLNRAAAWLDQWCDQPTGPHPQVAYTAGAMLAGELAAFGERRRGAAIPAYRHEDLAGCVEPLMADLRASLSAVLRRRAVPIEWQPGPHGTRVARLDDSSLLLDARFVLTATAPGALEALRTRLPPRVKLASADRLPDLLHLQLPGIPLLPLAVAPPQLPFMADAVVFGVDGHGHPLWEEVVRSGTLALHHAADLAEVRLELWALRT